MAHKTTRTALAKRHICVLERSKGFYWRHDAEKRLHGPFATLGEIVEDFDRRESKRVSDAIEAEEFQDFAEPVENLLGVPGWFDSDTGLPGEENLSRFSLH
jgi:hypothetical protein